MKTKLFDVVLNVVTQLRSKAHGLQSATYRRYGESALRHQLAKEQAGLGLSDRRLRANPD